MGIYTIPDSVISKLHVKGNSQLGDSSTNTLSLFGDAGVAQQSSCTDADVTTSATSVATQFNALLALIENSHLIGGT